MHLWDLKVGKYPWLTNPEVEETPFANIKNLAVNYLLPNYRQDTATVELAGLVHVEAAWDPTNPVAESKWLAKTLAGFETPYAIIAGGNLLKADFPELAPPRIKDSLGNFFDTIFLKVIQLSISHVTIIQTETLDKEK